MAKKVKKRAKTRGASKKHEKNKDYAKGVNNKRSTGKKANGIQQRKTPSRAVNRSTVSNQSRNVSRDTGPSQSR